MREPNVDSFGSKGMLNVHIWLHHQEPTKTNKRIGTSDRPCTLFRVNTFIAELFTIQRNTYHKHFKCKVPTILTFISFFFLTFGVHVIRVILLLTPRRTSLHIPQMLLIRIQKAMSPVAHNILATRSAINLIQQKSIEQQNARVSYLAYPRTTAHNSVSSSD